MNIFNFWYVVDRRSWEHITAAGLKKWSNIFENTLAER